jgi:fumarate reductase (CoM/CoB) subunit B
MQTGKAKILRYNPEVDSSPHYETYEFPFEKGMTVLDLAFYIYENIDGSFGFSYCCRNSYCGLCGTIINGKPGLMCRETATQEITLEPLNNLPVIRDLIIDRDEYDKKKDSLRLFLDRVNVPDEIPEQIDMEEFQHFKVASRCVECYSCVSGCPVLLENQHEFLGPAAMVQLARHAFDGRDDLNREVVAYSGGVYNCSTCKRCAEVCPHNIAPVENIELLREKLIKSGNVPRVLNGLIQMLQETERAITAPKKKNSFIEETLSGGNTAPANSKVGLFIGCNIDYDTRLMPIAEAAVKVLQHLDVDLAIPKEQACCGTPLKELGTTEKLNDLVLKNVESFKAAGVSVVLTLCSGCGLAGKDIWPKTYKKLTGEDMPFEVKDFTEFVVENTSYKDKLAAPVDLKVTYHDPCSLIRGQGVYEEPRAIIQAVPGVEFVESPKHCCGAGGGLRLTNLNMSQRITKTKLAPIKELDVDAIVTCCPNCTKQFNVGLAKEGLRKVKVMHPAMLLAQSMGLQ